MADFDNHRVQKFSRDGEFLAEFGSLGSGDGQFNHPIDVAVDAAGNVYVADGNNARVQIFDGSGQFLGAWNGQRTGAEPVAFVANVELDGEGNIYINDIESGRILKFRLLPPFAS